MNGRGLGGSGGIGLFGRVLWVGFLVFEDWWGVEGICGFVVVGTVVVGIGFFT